MIDMVKAYEKGKQLRKEQEENKKLTLCERIKKTLRDGIK